MLKTTSIILLAIVSLQFNLLSQDTQLLHNTYARDGLTKQSLDGQWKFIIDPYETGYRNHRDWTAFDDQEKYANSDRPYYADAKTINKWDRIEYDFDKADTIEVPGDWNSQKKELLYYEGSAWYRKKFTTKMQEDKRYFIHFGAVNYRTDVYLNGKKVALHLGGFDPFDVEVSEFLQNGENSLVLRVENERKENRVPNLTTDWWNYGGITRSVYLLELPETYIKDYSIKLTNSETNTLEGFIRVAGSESAQEVVLTIPELQIKESFETDESGFTRFSLNVKNLKKWYPERPYLYDVEFNTTEDKIADKIGFRTIETKGSDILLNGQSIFLRGISLHEEIPQRAGRAYSRSDAKQLMNWAKELNCNFIRLAHYPHNEHMPRLADEMGFLLWEEIPVYWGINYENEEAFNQAENQLKSLINRDKNRASVIVWSLANETPDTEERLAFLRKLKKTALSIDDSRLISAALERDEHTKEKVMTVPDPFKEDVDLVSVNEYIGWYEGLPETCQEVSWELDFDKPFFISEFGGGALHNYRGDSLTMWTEDYQAYLYREQLKMLSKITQLRGMTPWILADFRSPRRVLGGIQDGWNRKGLISDRGFKKMAFYILQDYYRKIEKQYAYEIED